MSRPVVRCVSDKPVGQAILPNWCVEINGRKVGAFSYDKNLVKFVAEWLDSNLPDAIKAAKGG